MSQARSVHVPILVQPIVDALIGPFLELPADAPPHYFVDCTLGGAGHTRAFLERLSSEPRLAKHRVIGIDRDARAIARAAETLREEIAQGRVELVHAPFSRAGAVMEGKPVLALLADLGFSSDQIEDSARGLSFQLEGPLDMRLDPGSGSSARELLSKVNERELETILSRYGEERFSRRIAQAIIRARQEGRLPATTLALADLVSRSVPPPARHGRLHPATRTFQALRIAVNDELEELETLLSRVILAVKPGGRVAIISFHSLEDRLVKHAFRARERFRALTRKPVEADEEEIRHNPRSRSAKLRIAERL